MSAFAYDGSSSVLARGPFASVDEVSEVARNHVAIGIDDADDAIMRCEREIETLTRKRERIVQHREQLAAWLSAEGYAIETHEDGTKALVKVERPERVVEHSPGLTETLSKQGERLCISVPATSTAATRRYAPKACASRTTTSSNPTATARLPCAADGAARAYRRTLVQRPSSPLSTAHSRTEIAHGKA